MRNLEKVVPVSRLRDRLHDKKDTLSKTSIYLGLPLTPDETQGLGWTRWCVCGGVSEQEKHYSKQLVK